MLKEFKKCAMKGNLIDIAVGFVMGAAFKQVVTSFTGGIISPLVGLIFKADFKDLKLIVKKGVADETGKMVGEPAPPAPKGPSQEDLLVEIRDLLAKKK